MTYRVTFDDGRTVTVRVAADAAGSRETLAMVARRRAATRRYHPGTLPDLLAATAHVAAVEIIR